MAQLNDSIVQGDLRVTGTIYAPVNGNDITVNGSTVPVTSASFFAPTTAGTANYLLARTGENSAPIWTEKATVAYNADLATTAMQYDTEGGTIKTALESKQDKPGYVTDGNIAVFNGTKDTVDSYRSFTQSTDTWDGYSDAYVPTAAAVQRQINARNDCVSVYIPSGKALYINMALTSRTGRSTALIVLAGNNGNYCCLQLSWFKGSNSAALSNVHAHIIASSDNVGYATVPVIKYQPSLNNVCSIFLILDNATISQQTSSVFSTTALIFPCVENNNTGLLTYGTIDSAMAQAAPNTVTNAVYNLIGNWDSYPTSNSVNAVTSHGIWLGLSWRRRVFMLADSTMNGCPAYLYDNINGNLLHTYNAGDQGNMYLQTVLNYGSMYATEYCGGGIRYFHVILVGNSTSNSIQYLIQQYSGREIKAFKEGTRNILTVQNIGNAAITIDLQMGGRDASVLYYDNWVFNLDGVRYYSSQPIDVGFIKHWTIGSVQANHSKSWEIVVPHHDDQPAWKMARMNIVTIA